MQQRKLLEQTGVFQYFFEHHPDSMFLTDGDGHVLDINNAALNMLGYSREEVFQTSLNQWLDWPEVNRNYTDEDAESRFELAIPHKEGYLIYVRMTCMPLVSDGQEIGRILTFEDLTELKDQRKELFSIQDKLLFVSEKSQNIISSFSPDGVFTYISPSVKALLGYTPEEVIGKQDRVFNHPDDNIKLRDARDTVFFDQDTVRFTGRVRHKNGDYRWYETTVEVIRNQSGHILQKICVGRDITDRKEAEETITHLAYHDTLTELPNRRLFKRRVEQLLNDFKHEHHALMLLDLDGFKDVNDTFGHEIGDLLLIEVAKRLTQAVGDKGFVARWAGDEFTVICKNIKNRSTLNAVIEHIKVCLSDPIQMGGHTLFITASIGVSLTCEDGNTVEDLIKKADAAMYREKNHTKI